MRTKFPKRKHTKKATAPREEIRATVSYKDRAGKTWVSQFGNMMASDDGKVLRHIDLIRWT